MSGTPPTNPEPADSLPTEPLQLADQQPVEAAVHHEPAPASGRGSSHTLLAVVGGALAVGLLALTGVIGFAVGHFTSDGRSHDRTTSDRTALQGGAEAGGATGGRGQGQGQGQGVDPRGIDPDGDNWTGGMGQGQGQGALPGQGTAPTTPQLSTNPSGA